jgi:hypothetical protein
MRVNTRLMIRSEVKMKMVNIQGVVTRQDESTLHPKYFDGSQSGTSMYQKYLEHLGDVQQNINQAGSHSPKMPDTAIEPLMGYGSERESNERIQQLREDAGK